MKVLKALESAMGSLEAQEGGSLVETCSFGEPKIRKMKKTF